MEEGVEEGLTLKSRLTEETLHLLSFSLHRQWRSRSCAVEKVQVGGGRGREGWWWNAYRLCK